jgi:hypothetical protein
VALGFANPLLGAAVRQRGDRLKANDGSVISWGASHYLLLNHELLIWEKWEEDNLITVPTFG